MDDDAQARVRSRAGELLARMTLAEKAEVINTTLGGRAASTQQADVIDLTNGNTNELANRLEKIDLSGFNGQVILDMQQGLAVGSAQTDVTFNLSAYNANITLSNVAGGGIANITHNSVFDFNGAGSVQVPTQWTVPHPSRLGSEWTARFIASQ